MFGEHVPPFDVLEAIFTYVKFPPRSHLQQDDYVRTYICFSEKEKQNKTNKKPVGGSTKKEMNETDNELKGEDYQTKKQKKTSEGYGE